MELRDFRIGWRVLVADPTYSVAVILGLAVGLAVCFLLLGFVHYSFNYDSHVPELDQVYVVKHRLNFISRPQWVETISVPARTAALQSGLVDEATIVIQQPVVAQIEDRPAPFQVSAVDKDFPALFGTLTLAGDLASALSRPEGLALTRSTAQRMFGGGSVIGRAMRIGDNNYQVLALVQDPPPNTTLPYEALVGMNSTALTGLKNAESNWSGIGGKLYLRLKAGVSQDAMTHVLQEAYDHSPAATGFAPEMLQKLGNQKSREIRLGRLRDAYFDSEVAGSFRSGPRGNKLTVLGIGAVALLTLALAAANYVNLAAVRTLRRQREIGVRLVMGATPMRIALLFISESVLVAALAAMLGLLLAWLVLPVFSDLVGLDLRDFFGPASVTVGILSGVVVGLLVGMYPSWLALRVRPHQALSGRGADETARGMLVRKILTSFQFSTAMGLTGLAIIVAGQTAFAIDSYPGFDPGPLVVIDLPEDRWASPAAKRSFREALTRLPNVSIVAAAMDAVGRNTPLTGFDGDMHRPGRASLRMRWENVSPEYFDTYGLRPVAGRLFDPKLDSIGKANDVVINEAAARAFGFENAGDAVGQMVVAGVARQNVTTGTLRRIIGIAPPLRHRSLRDRSDPYMYVLSDQWTPVLIVRTVGGVAEAERAIESLWRERLPNAILNLNRASVFFTQTYAEDLRMTRLLAAASVIAISIASFGIYVLAAYSVQRRAREIALRKIHGADRIAIARLLIREFLVLIAAGAAVGLPIAWIVGQQYLSNFVERAPIGAWAMLIALGLAALAAIISVLQHLLAAMRISPADALNSN